jgi:hypothetical protein
LKQLQMLYDKYQWKNWINFLLYIK